MLLYGREVVVNDQLMMLVMSDPWRGAHAGIHVVLVHLIERHGAGLDVDLLHVPAAKHMRPPSRPR